MRSVGGSTWLKRTAHCCAAQQVAVLLMVFGEREGPEVHDMDVGDPMAANDLCCRTPLDNTTALPDCDLPCFSVSHHVLEFLVRVSVLDLVPGHSEQRIAGENDQNPPGYRTNRRLVAQSLVFVFRWHARIQQGVVLGWVCLQTRHNCQ